MSAAAPSKLRRDEVIDALRRGTVPSRGLDLLAVGLDRFGPTIDEELARASAGSGVFKCIRGEWGSGKTFAARWIADRARRAGFVTSEIQVSETSVEYRRVQQDRAALLGVSLRSGGRYGDADLGDMVGRVDLAPRETESLSEVTLRTSILLFLLVLGLLSAEWILRKRAGMI